MEMADRKEKVMQRQTVLIGPEVPFYSEVPEVPEVPFYSWHLVRFSW